MTILAGDIGGTKTLLRLSDNNQVIFENRYHSSDYGDLLSMLREFLLTAKETLSVKQLLISKACFGIAGPIQKGTIGYSAKVTNLPWIINAQEIETALSIEKVILINDFKAIAYAIDVLDKTDTYILQKGKQITHDPKVVIGAGTGLGSAFLVFNGSRYEVFSSESSHAAFAPINDIQIDLLIFLRKKYKQVSYEHIVSGPGLINIFEFLQAHFNQQPINALSQ